MVTTRKLPDLVTDSKLFVELYETHAHHFNIRNDNSFGQYLRRIWKKETGMRTKRLGGGASGEVWLEECRTGEKSGQLQAVKVISKSSPFDIYQELETIDKFSQSTSKYDGLFVKALGWYENERSPSFLNCVWGSLDQEHRDLQQRILLTYQNKLELATLEVSELERSSALGDGPAQRRRRAARYILVVKKPLDLGIQRLQAWAAEFDPTWWLILRMADKGIDKSLDSELDQGQTRDAGRKN